MSKDDARCAGEKKKALVLAALPDGLQYSDTPIQIVVGEPEVLPDGTMTVGISFVDDSIRRESLAPDQYPEGVDNIIRLFTHGWKAGGAVRGEWRGELRWSLRTRPADPFLQQAVDNFNRLGLGMAELRQDYQ